ncbi:DUF4097 family beta strand repeat-containing protein [Nocardioides coralli]|uniref:DUF4097 family beta strand repeat-containing protein n=1 Tax=Nocardioides coralli TaxID=2872154 RepID=UPI001CA459A2|nr:DUF4097 family beta strand repeat-containing protein [Nocardioides coralli]QZY28926.1 DUF4097 domain-containing protein [Nocardioides coralli]
MTEHHFDTPDPVALYVDTRSGDVRVTATATTESRVQITGREAEEVEVRHEGRELSIVVPRRRSGFFLGDDRLSIAVTVPTGSDLAVHSGSAQVSATGEVGMCMVRTGSGDVRLDLVAGTGSVETGSGDVAIDEARAELRVKCGSGDVSLGRAHGAVGISTGSGDVEIGSHAGPAVVKTGSGDVHVVEASTDLSLTTGSGDLKVDTARRGRFSAKGASGSVHVGIPAGLPVWTDISTVTGRIHNAVQGTGQPADGADHLELRATTVSGDVFLVQH